MVPRTRCILTVPAAASRSALLYKRLIRCCQHGTRAFFPFPFKSKFSGRYPLAQSDVKERLVSFQSGGVGDKIHTNHSVGDNVTDPCAVGADPVFMCSDPPSHLGSGGGTIHALYQYFLNSESKTTKTTRQTGPFCQWERFFSWVGNAPQKIKKGTENEIHLLDPLYNPLYSLAPPLIMIHAGGCSRRLPAYSARGKMLVPLAVPSAATFCNSPHSSDNEIELNNEEKTSTPLLLDHSFTLFTYQYSFCQQIAQLLPPTMFSLVVACGDVAVVGEERAGHRKKENCNGTRTENITSHLHSVGQTQTVEQSLSQCEMENNFFTITGHEEKSAEEAMRSAIRDSIGCSWEDSENAPPGIFPDIICFGLPMTSNSSQERCEPLSSFHPALSRHGVFVLHSTESTPGVTHQNPNASRTSSEGSSSFRGKHSHVALLQKPAPSKLMEWRSKCPESSKGTDGVAHKEIRNSLLLDIGVWVLNSRALSLLSRKSLEKIDLVEKNDRSDGINLQNHESGESGYYKWKTVDLYTDLLPTDTFIPSNFCRLDPSEGNSGAGNSSMNIHKHPGNDLHVVVVPLPSSFSWQFLHFGSTVELLGSTKGFLNHCMSKQSLTSGVEYPTRPLWNAGSCSTLLLSEESESACRKISPSNLVPTLSNPSNERWKNYYDSSQKSCWDSTSLFPWHLFADSCPNPCAEEWKRVSSHGNDVTDNTSENLTLSIFSDSCTLSPNMGLHHHHVLTGILPNSWCFTLPAYTCVDMVPVRILLPGGPETSLPVSRSDADGLHMLAKDDITVVLRPYHFHDNFKGSLSKPKELKFLHARSLWHWMTERGLTMDMLRPERDQGITRTKDRCVSAEEDEDFWEFARLFPTVTLRSSKVDNDKNGVQLERTKKLVDSVYGKEMYWLGELLKWMVYPPPSSMTLKDCILSDDLPDEPVNEKYNVTLKDGVPMDECKHWLFVRQLWINSLRLSAGEIYHVADMDSAMRISRDISHWRANILWKREIMDEKENNAQNESPKDVLLDYDDLSRKCLKYHWKPVDSFLTAFCSSKGYNPLAFLSSNNHDNRLSVALQNLIDGGTRKCSTDKEEKIGLLWDEEKMSPEDQELLLMQCSAFFARMIEYACSDLRQTAKNTTSDSLYDLVEQIAYTYKLLAELEREDWSAEGPILSETRKKETESSSREKTTKAKNFFFSEAQRRFTNIHWSSSQVDAYCDYLMMVAQSMSDISKQMMQRSLVTPFLQRRGIKWMRDGDSLESQKSIPFYAKRDDPDDEDKYGADGGNNNAVEVFVRSPVRIDLCGGWTDTPPYSLWYGGCVINVAVNFTDHRNTATHTWAIPAVGQSTPPVLVHVYPLTPMKNTDQERPAEFATESQGVTYSDASRCESGTLQQPCIRIRSMEHKICHYFPTFESISDALHRYGNGSAGANADAIAIPIFALMLLGFLPTRYVPELILKNQHSSKCSHDDNELSFDPAAAFPTLSALLDSNFKGHGIAIDIDTKLPTGSGMGTSSILAAAVLEALLVYCEKHGRRSKVSLSSPGVTGPRVAEIKETVLPLCHTPKRFCENKDDCSSATGKLWNSKSSHGTEESTGMVLLMEQLLGIGGGWQDAYGGAIGGIKKLDYRCSCSYYSQECLKPLRIWGSTPSPITTKPFSSILFTHPLLQPCHILYFTGITRQAKSILSEIVHDTFLQKKSVMSTLTQVHGLTEDMSLLLAEMDEQLSQTTATEKALFFYLERYGKLIEKSWTYNKSLDHGVSNCYIDRLLTALQPHIFGAKLCGAGGGGFLYMVAKNSNSARIIVDALDGGKDFLNVSSPDYTLPEREETRRIRSQLSLHPGGRIQPFTLAEEGMTVHVLPYSVKKMF